MSSAVEIVARCASASRAEALVIALVNGMVGEHGWQAVDDPADRMKHLCLVGADTVDEARRLLVQMPEWQRPHTLLVGIEGELFQLGWPEPGPGTIGELLETFQLAGYLPADCVSAWRPILSGFAGRKDLMRRMGTNCVKASQSDSYCDWVHSPGRDVFEFLAAFGRVLIAADSGDGAVEP
jgi:hypothetical protein